MTEPDTRPFVWDTPGLPPRERKDRCAVHASSCAYRDDDPNLCPTCHQTWTKINGSELNRTEHTWAHRQAMAREAKKAERRAAKRAVTG